MLNRPIAAVVLAVGILASSCGGGSAPTRDRLTDALVTSGLPRSQARCAANKIFSELDSGQRRQLAEQGSGALKEKTSTKLSQALATCR